jgi:23S rRNA-/tRNA-specific pseudouridylate synthase
MGPEILFEDGEALVIDKPGGLPIDRPRAGGPCLEDSIDDLKLGFQRAPVPVHRLDRDTSGCLLLARNPKALKRFSAAFEERLSGHRGGGTRGRGRHHRPFARESQHRQGWLADDPRA